MEKNVKAKNADSFKFWGGMNIKMENEQRTKQKPIKYRDTYSVWFDWNFCV